MYSSRKGDRGAQTSSARHKVLGFALAVALALVTAPVARAQSCITDLQGADDEPGQKDLSEFCRGAGTCTGGFVVTYYFDDVQWTGSNPGDGCALFDTDNDGKANFVICATLFDGGLGGPPSISGTTCYSCADTRPDRCTNPTSIPCSSSCTVSFGSDPFASNANHTSTKCKGTNCTTSDSLVTCCLHPGDFGGSGNLIDVCSYPSSNPNSDPSDCIVSAPCTSNTQCNDNNPCSVDTCDPTSGVCVHTAASSTTQCRPSAGTCDAAENCDGSSLDCPADAFKPATTTCRASAGDCDVAESCSGTGPDCPADAFKPATTTCRASAGDCDVAESCS